MNGESAGKKPINMIHGEAQETGEHSLKRALGAVNLVSLGIGAIIGAGIFVLTGAAAAQYAGPAIVLLVHSGRLGLRVRRPLLCRVRLDDPDRRVAYTYGYATLGEIFAWIIGWDLILEYAFGAATVASGWSGYVLELSAGHRAFTFRLPWRGTPGAAVRACTTALGSDWTDQLALWTANDVDPGSLPHVNRCLQSGGFLGIALVTTILVIGIKESANFNSIIVVVRSACC